MHIAFEAETLSGLLAQLQRFMDQARSHGAVPLPGYGIERGLASMGGSLAAGPYPPGHPVAQVARDSYRDGYEAGQRAMGAGADAVTAALNRAADKIERVVMSDEFPDVADTESAAYLGGLADRHQARANELRSASITRQLNEAQQGTYPRPEGMKDYPQANEVNSAWPPADVQQANQATPISRNPYLDPGPVTTQREVELKALAAQAERNRQMAEAATEQRQKTAYASSPETVAETLKRQGHQLPGE